MRIVVLEPLGVSEEKIRSIASPLTEKGHELVLHKNKVTDKNTLISRSAGADILVLANMPLVGDVIKSDSELKMISIAFTGVDHVDLSACKEKDVTVCNAAGYSTYSVAELTYGLIFSVLRNIVPLDITTRKGGTKEGFSQREIFGKTIGIVGTGAIGMKVAQIAKAFGCKVLAYSRTKKEAASELGITYLTLDELLSQSDVVSIHVPLNDTTNGLISKEKIALMKPSAILINTARGPIIDNSALAEALKNNNIFGAGLDVFEIEPPLPKDHPLFDAPNLVVTPHIAFATEEAMVNRAEIVFENIVKWIEGNPQNLVSL